MNPKGAKKEHIIPFFTFNTYGIFKDTVFIYRRHPMDLLALLEDRSEVTPTLNKHGYAFNCVSEFTKAFHDFAGTAKKPVIDVGCAFGFNTLHALNRGAKVHAFDMDQQHLSLLRNQSPREFTKRLHLVKAHFPQEFNFPDNSISGVLLANLLNFLHGIEVRVGLSEVFRCLEPGGQVFIESPSPYVKIRDDYIPVYEKAVADGLEWPGEVKNINDYGPEGLFVNFPNFIHIFDPNILTRELQLAGFTIEQSCYFRRPYTPEIACLDGREAVGAIGKKPIE